MNYKNIEKGLFLSRPNRFIANILMDGQTQLCHVKNTGRCKELFLPNTPVYLEKSDNANRKTKYDLVSIYKGEKLVNIDSQIVNHVFHEWLLKGELFKNITLIKPECKYQSSRFDFYVEADNKRAFIEVKGVSLEEDGMAMFPDAPTERGLKHVNELRACLKEGYEAYVFFIIQMKGVRYFTPNKRTHPQFADALYAAKEQGVHVTALDCIVTKDSITADQRIKVRLCE